MPPNYRFILEPYNGPKTRYRCPGCHKKEFTRYIDVGRYDEYIDDSVGKCNRMKKCAYHLSPSEYFEDKNSVIRERISPLPIITKTKKTSFIPNRYLEQSFKFTGDNHFLSYLKVFMSEVVIAELKKKYYIGTSRKWYGASIFWQVDDKKKARTGKCILYNSDTGKKNKINWVHSMAKIPDFNLEQCLFGLHLLKLDSNKSIAIVESEKTAIIASIAFPEYIWMATGGLNNLKTKLLQPLKGRNVILFPDAGCYTIWRDKISILPSDINIQVSDLLYRIATPEQKRKGLDIADFIIEIWKSN